MASLAAPNALHELMRTGRKYTFRKGQVVHSSDGRLGLTLVDSGFVMRYQITNTGVISIQSIYGKDNFYPLTLVFQLLFDQQLYTGPETIFYETIADTELYSLDAELFIKKVKEEPALYPALFQEAGKRFYSNIQQLENISLSGSTQRLAHQLAYYADQFGTKKPNGTITIDLPLTHSLLAGVLSLTRETVSQSIGELRKRKLIKTERRTIIVPNLQQLQEFSYT